MNAISELIQVLTHKGIRLGLEDNGSLRLRGDQRQLNESLISDIKQHKEQLVAMLKSQLPFALLSEAERERLPKDVVEAYPLSALQAGMVFHTQLEQFSGIYHDIMCEHVRCEWDQACFERALELCVQEHPVLRSGFVLEGERALQVVYERVALPLEVQDLKGLSEAQQSEYLKTWIEQRKCHEFGWERGPLCSIHVFLRSDASFEFVMSFHHAVLDGWSRASLTTQLYQRYERLLRGEPVSAGEVNWTYREFIALEQQVLGSDAAKGYFAKLLEDAPAAQLPRLRATPEGSGSQRYEVVEGFGPLSGRLLELSRRLGVPLQSVLLAVHLKVLATLSGQSRVLSCVTYNGRPERADAERAVGMFLNSVPLALELKGCSWRALIEQVSQLSRECMAYRHYPLLQIQRDLGRPFSEVLFNYTHFHVYQELGGEGRLESLGSSGFEQTNFDLLVDVARGLGDEEPMRLALVYDERVFDAAVISRVGEYFVNACEWLLRDVDRAHQQCSVLGEEERAQLRRWRNDSPAQLCSGERLPELFEQQVERSPEAIAVQFEGERLSYAQLNERANQLAHHLRSEGVGPESLVGLCVERSLEMVIGILAILKAGGAYVPLDPAYPPERLKYMVEDSGTKLLLTLSGTSDALQSDGLRRVELDSDSLRQALQRQPRTNPPRAAGEEAGNLAYVIYTSGSTGRPKGVMVEHRQVQRLLSATQEDFRFGASDVWTLFHSYAFDFSVWELWGALAYGGRLIVVPGWMTRSPEEFYELLSREGVTVLNQTPTAFGQLIQVDAERSEPLQVRVVVFGGEALNFKELRGWVERHTDAQPVLVNMYGITETTVHVTYRRVRQADIEAESGSVIGRPLKDLSVHVLDPLAGEVPIGTAGEMYVGGGGVSRGYLHQPQLTSQRFVEHSAVPGERLYRTGDLARYLPNGELEYLGRIDHQVKIRGHRIELGEIEQALSGLPGVSASVVMAREGAGGQKQLVAYVVPNEAVEESRQGERIAEYRQALSERLPQYMVPSAFVLLEQLPLTANGKVDRKALPEVQEQLSLQAYVAPRDELERTLCEVWQEVLGRSQVGIRDNFFSVGGDSILSIRIVALLRRRGWQVGVKELFQYQTIEELAPRVQRGESEEREHRPFELLSEAERERLGKDVVEAYPLSALQAGMVFHTQLEQFSGIYHDIMCEHVKCEWDQACFERALEVCVQEHPVLRSGFVLEGERALQVVYERVELPLQVQDLKGMSESQQQEYLSEWVERRKRHEFDWERGPLCSIHVFLRSEASFEFVMSFHHAVLDGWSRASLTTQLYQRYERLLRGEPVSAGEVNWTYREFIALEQQVLGSDQAKAYFAGLLDEAPAVQLPRGKSLSAHREELRTESFAPSSAELLEEAPAVQLPRNKLLSEAAGVHEVFRAESFASSSAEVLEEVPEAQLPRNKLLSEAAGVHEVLRAESFVPSSAEVLEEVPEAQLPRNKLLNEAAGVHEVLRVESFTPMSARVLELSRQMGVSVQSVLLAVHFKVLSLLSGQPHALSCVTHNGRPEQQGAEAGLGLFLNSLPLCLAVPGGTWRELIDRVVQLSTQSVAYRRYPLSQIQQELGRSFSEVTFNYTHFHVYNEIRGESAAGLQVLGSSGFEQTNFDFHVDFSRALDADELGMNLIYDIAVFDRAFIERVAGYYLRAFEQLLQDIDAAHEAHPLLSAEELELLRVKWNGPHVQIDGRSVLERFEEQARATPDAVAGICAGERLSYRELYEKAQRLASYLVQAGLSRQARVGIYLPRGLEMLIAVLGVMKAGGTYVPLERSWPSKRLEYVLKDAEVQWVLLSSRWLEGVALGGVDVVLMDGAGSEAGWLEEYGEEAEADRTRVPARTNGSRKTEPPWSEARKRGAQLSDAAYVLYTSGSTGEPKGVVIEHGGLLNYVSHAAREYLAPELQGSVVSSPLGFDATLTTLLTPLLMGKAVQLLPEAEDESLEGLRQRLFAEDEGAWLFKITPAHLEALEALQEQSGGGSSSQSHWIIVGGEQLSVRVLRRWKQQWLPRAVFVNEYGPTETVVGCSTCTVRELEELERLDGTAVPIGRAIGNVQLYVVGPGQHLQPVQCVGELYIGGAGVAREYLGRPELTSERFVQDWLSGEGRLYRSGDLVRWLPSGELEFIGRRDEQVKIRGYRIELGEIEQALSELPGVSASVVMAREVAGGQKQLVAYVVPGEMADESSRADGVAEYRQAQSDRLPQTMVPRDAVVEESRRAEQIAAYRQALSERLPQYMVPSAFVLLEQLPLTANGKVDRKALPDVQEQLSLQAYVAPRDQLERTLCEVWQEVLGRQQVGIRDNFFSVGGDSILSIRIVALLRRRGWQVGVKELFQYQTIEELAPRVQRSQEGDEREHRPFELLSETERERLSKDVVEAYPLSALQAGMVFHTQLEQFSGIYHDIMCEHVRCEWDQACFERALELCVQEHPVLRSGFVLEGERALQVVYERVALPLQVQDLKGLSETQQSEYLSEWVERRKRHEFDWERGPLCSIHIFLRSEESFEFVMSFHHAVLDGWSRASLTTQLYQRYERLLRGEPVSAGEVNWTYRQFIELEQQVLGSDQAKAYFAGLLEEAPAVQLPRNKPLSTPSQANHEVLRVESFTPLSARVLELSRRLGVSVQSVLLAAHFKVLSLLSGQPHALSCVTHNGRPEQQGAEAGLGLFLNSLPLCLAVPGGTWRELIDRVVQLSTQSVAYRRYPLSQIAQELGRSFSEVTFNYTHFHVYNEIRGESAAGLQVLGSSGFEQTNFDLTVDVQRGLDGESMRLSFYYDAAVFDPDFIGRLGHYYVRAFERMLTDLDERHDQVSLLSPQEARQLIDWSATLADFAEHIPVHERFEAQVARTPDAIAVMFGDQQLTYRELNARANQLAHYLIAHGVRTDTPVGLCLGRSIQLLVGVLGVLKAGGAYVPLDPAYPRERLTYMLEDCGASLVLTQQSANAAIQLDPLTVIDLDNIHFASEIDALPSTNVVRTTVSSSTDLAYIIYTSGSTGQPKGVEITQGGLTNYLAHAVDTYTRSDLHGAVMSSPLSFDATITTLFTPLLTGRPLVILPEDSAALLSGLTHYLLNQQGSWLFKLTPTHLDALAQQAPARARSSARHVIVIGGEQLTSACLKRWKTELLPDTTYINEYGPTETVVGCSIYVLNPDMELDAQRPTLPIGRPIRNTRLYVLRDGNPVPMGGVGELHIGGAGVARGYHNRTELTHERFIADPFDSRATVRLYRTGDRVRYLADGNLEFLGRFDDQVKIRGHRIELGEIEHRLSAAPRVRSAVVVAREDETGERGLVAYVTLHDAPEDPHAAATLRRYLAQQLPEYMVPAALVVLQAFPLTVNGKVDKKALPSPNSIVHADRYVAPRTAVEVAVCEIWREVLGIEVGVHANFFESGGHSVRAMRAATLLRRRFELTDTELPLTALFEHQTVESLSQRIAVRLQLAELKKNLEGLDAAAAAAEEGFI